MSGWLRVNDLVHNYTAEIDLTATAPATGHTPVHCIMPVCYSANV